MNFINKMNVLLTSENKNIRKIEDIIDLQKANGNIISAQQVLFELPFEKDNKMSASITKSLESGLSKIKVEKHTKKVKKRLKHVKNSTSDAISWPSDSDITVLRMKLPSKPNHNDKVGSVIAGDGLHQPASQSMINLAAIMLQSQPSKQNINIDEYLLPLTSWEHSAGVNQNKVNSNKTTTVASCNQYDEFNYRKHELIDSNTKSKVARFLRLYFCPCCSCLYKIEKMQDEPSAYFTKHQGNIKRI